MFIRFIASTVGGRMARDLYTISSAVSNAALRYGASARQRRINSREYVE